jgi:hypothetical protein
MGKEIRGELGGLVNNQTPYRAESNIHLLIYIYIYISRKFQTSDFDKMIYNRKILVLVHK